MKIKKILGCKILDSAGNWTVETTVELKDGAVGVASVPSGVSVSGFEARAVSARQAVKNVTGPISKGLKGLNVDEQREIDEVLLELDGTSNKSKLGANSMLSVSLAVCRAAAASSNLPLYKYISEKCQMSNVKCQINTKYQIPKPMVLLFEGGKHGSGKLKAQEFMAVAKDVKHGLKLYQTVREHLQKTGQSVSVGLEGGFTPDLEDPEAVDILNYILGGNPLALDIAFDSCENEHLNYQKFLGGRNAISLEDPFATDDWRTWTEFTKSWGAQILIVADDLVATNPVRLKKAIELAAANAVIIKPNQIGTLTETLEVVKMARESGWKTIVSHRADETSDDFIADLAVGVGADYVKFGGFSRGERLAKYNRLLGIQKEL
jgi:enolase